jgi:hypothetical protein
VPRRKNALDSHVRGPHIRLVLGVTVLDRRGRDRAEADSAAAEGCGGGSRCTLHTTHYRQAVTFRVAADAASLRVGRCRTDFTLRSALVLR